MFVGNLVSNLIYTNVYFYAKRDSEVKDNFTISFFLFLSFNVICILQGLISCYFYVSIIICYIFLSYL